MPRLIIPTLALALVTTGCPGSLCEVPEGSYQVQVSASSGDCPESVTDAISEQIAQQRVVVSGGDDACGARQVTASATDAQTGCEISAAGAAQLDDRGLGEFDMTVEVAGQGCQLECAQVVRVAAAGGA